MKNEKIYIINIAARLAGIPGNRLSGGTVSRGSANLKSPDASL